MSKEELQNDPITLAYVAGLFDGEGCVNVQIKKGGRLVRAQLSMTNTSRKIVTIMQEVFGGSVCVRKPNGRKVTGVWTVSGAEAERAADLLSRFCTEKKFQLESFVKLRKMMGNHQGCVIEPHILVERNRLANAIRSAKQDSEWSKHAA